MTDVAQCALSFEDIRPMDFIVERAVIKGEASTPAIPIILIRSGSWMCHALLFTLPLAFETVPLCSELSLIGKIYHELTYRLPVSR